MNASNSNAVGVIGAGRLGQAMARTAMRAGRQIVISNSSTSLTATTSTSSSRTMPRAR